MSSESSPWLPHPGLPLQSQCPLGPHTWVSVPFPTAPTTGLIQVPGSLSLHWPCRDACSRSCCLCSSRTEVSTEPSRAAPLSAERLQRLQGSVPQLCPQALWHHPFLPQLTSLTPATYHYAAPGPLHTLVPHPTSIHNFSVPGYSSQRTSLANPLASYLELSRNYPLVYPVSPPFPSSGMQLWHRWGTWLFCSRLTPTSQDRPCCPVNTRE